MMHKDFGGNTSKTHGAMNVELTIGSNVAEPPKLQGPHAPVTVQRPLTSMHAFPIT